jgi:hypothetical protein
MVCSFVALWPGMAFLLARLQHQVWQRAAQAPAPAAVPVAPEAAEAVCQAAEARGGEATRDASWMNSNFTFDAINWFLFIYLFIFLYIIFIYHIVSIYKYFQYNEIHTYIYTVYIYTDIYIWSSRRGIINGCFFFKNIYIYNLIQWRIIASENLIVDYWLVIVD